VRQADIRDPQTYAIIGACMEIHSQLGHGFLEAVYQEAALIEFATKNIPFEREVQLQIRYKDVLLPTHYRPDFICFSRVIVEFKAQRELTNIDEAQLINYLKATGYHRGILVNFGAPSLQYRRLVWGKEE
jgi:GxxExxY protein